MRAAKVIFGQPLVERDGKPNRIGTALLQTIAEVLRRLGGPTQQWVEFPEYTVAQLQALAAAAVKPPNGATAVCSDETGGRTLACYSTSSGDFERVSDGAAIST